MCKEQDKTQQSLYIPWAKSSLATTFSSPPQSSQVKSNSLKLQKSFFFVVVVVKAISILNCNGYYNNPENSLLDLS